MNNNGTAQKAIFNCERHGWHSDIQCCTECHNPSFNNFLAMQFSEDGKQMQIQIAPAKGVPLNRTNLVLSLHTLHMAVGDYLKEQEEKMKSNIISTVPDSVIERLRK